jgi:N-formylglutamate amidohydrolase
MMNLPFIISVPHCSSRVPEEVRFAIALTDEEIKECTDLCTEEIFGSIPARAVLCAQWTRFVVDLNRGTHQRDPKGVIAHVDYHGRTVYHVGSVPDEKETERRLKRYYFPFHKRLREALDSKGIKGLCDCHSLYGIGPAEAPDLGEIRKDIILSNNGDERGNINPVLGTTTCPAETVCLMKEAFQSTGFSVAINVPYAGGFITTHYGRNYTRTGKIAVQIEINQDLYLAPATVRPLPEKLEDVKARVLQSFQQIAKEL